MKGKEGADIRGDGKWSKKPLSGLRKRKSKHSGYRDEKYCAKNTGDETY